MSKKYKTTTRNAWKLNIPDEGKVDKLLKDCIIKHILTGSIYVTNISERHSEQFPCTTRFNLHVALPNVVQLQEEFTDAITYYELSGYYEKNDSVLHLTAINLSAFNARFLPFKPMPFVDVPGENVIPINITIAPTDDDYVPLKVFREIESTKILLDKRVALEMMHDNPDSVRMRLDGCIRTDEVMEAEFKAQMEKAAAQCKKEEKVESN